MKKFKDNVLHALFFVAVIRLLPILIPLSIIDDIREDNFNDRRSKAEYYQRII